MRGGWLVVLAGCGRIGFDPNGARDGQSDTLTTANSNVAFLSRFLVVPGSLAGVAGADERCTMAANMSGLDGPFVAFLSSSTSNVVDRLAGVRGWKRPDGLPLADRLEDFAGGVRHLINLDEHGDYVTGSPPIATATNAMARVDATLGTCTDWTEPSATNVEGGRSDMTGVEFANGGLATCDTAAHLFCFGARSSTPLESVRVQGRVAFITEADWKPGGGRGSADTLCSTEATAAGLSGSYAALLPTQTTTAASRFDLGGPPWVRVDGARIAATPMGLMTQRLDTTLNLTARGIVNDAYVWTGYSTKDATGIGESTCNDWQSTMMNALGGLGDSRLTIFLYDEQNGGNGGPCNSGYPVYCLQK